MVLATEATPLSIQERLYPGLTCFGCGQANADGLRLRSYDGGDGVVARFMPWPQHDNGLGYLNGGIIATVLDCHGAAAVMLEAERREWPALGGAALPYVTAGIEVAYLRPSPLTESVELHGEVVDAQEAEIRVRVELRWDDRPRAVGTARWLRWRPR